jgi:hypothetical protein
MRLGLACCAFFTISGLAYAQGVPSLGTPSVEESKGSALSTRLQGTPSSVTKDSTFHQAKMILKKQVNKAIDGKPYPALDNWRPLTTREKFDLFLRRTYSPRTFAAVGIDAIKDDVIKNKNREYERGFQGLGQHYGVLFGTGETTVFFEQFLVPSLLKQDPRYFRNPSLPTGKRIFYSLTRVLITRADDGHSTFNASRIVGGSMAQALSDLYVPGCRQGFSPIADRVTFDLARDSVFNLVHEFWPDLRRKFLHRR